MAILQDIYDSKISDGVLDPDADQQRAIVALDDLLVALSKPGQNFCLKTFFFWHKPAVPRGLYLYGGVGRGKSMAMDLFFDTITGVPKRRVHFHAFMLEVHDFLHQRRRDRRTAQKQTRIEGDLMACAAHMAKEARLLCFDEFHVKDVADAMILGRLFTALFDQGVVTVMTSNIAPDDLYAEGLQRDRFLPFIALLKEKTDIHHFAGDTDYRLNRLRGRQTYFWPHDADAAAALDQLFRAVSDDAPGAPLSFEVKGRPVHVPRAHREIAAFTFAELCEAKRSALDYLALLKRFRVFVLSDVPKMDDRRRDAVLRFITFVDTAYDHRARLVVSAAAAPEQLYHGDMHAEAFQRTVSRLMEMQSQGYGGITPE